MNPNSSSSLIQQWFALSESREVHHEHHSHPFASWVKLHLHH